MRVVPAWVPIWSLFSGALCLLQLPFFLIAPSSLTFNTGTRCGLFVSAFWHSVVFGVPVIVSSIPLVWFCFQKQQQHRTMLDQMSHFDVRNASCALETDRVVIKRAVARLFRSELAGSASGDDLDVALLSMPLAEGSADEILDAFNTYVRGPLRESVVRNVGNDVDIPLKLCALGILPLLFVVPLYSCEGHMCETYARHLGATSTTPLMIINGLLNFVCIPGTHCLTFPMQMRGSALISAKVQHKRLQLLLVLLLGILMECTRWTFASVVYGTGIVVVVQYSPLWLAGLVLCLSLLCWHFWLLFLKPAEDHRPELP